MHMHELSKANRARCEAHDGFRKKIDDWSLSDWMTATVGELGEAANVVKKLLRHFHDQPGNAEKDTLASLKQDLADELADTQIYLDLLAQRAGIDLEKAVIAKFNKTSKKIGYPHDIEDNVVAGRNQGEWMDKVDEQRRGGA